MCSNTFKVFYVGSKLLYLYSAYEVVLHLNRTALYFLINACINELFDLLLPPKKFTKSRVTCAFIFMKIFH